MRRVVTLSGFSTLRREGLDLPAEFTATVNGELTVGSLEETITVSGEASDGRSPELAGPGAVRAGDLQSLPGTGRLATLSAIIPGATLRRENDRGVGGLSDRTQTAYSVHGAPEAQPVVDGMNHHGEPDVWRLRLQPNQHPGSGGGDERRGRRPDTAACS